MTDYILQGGINMKDCLEVENKTKKEDEIKVAVPCETYSRIVGYFRPTKQWNPGKQQLYLLHSLVVL